MINTLIYFIEGNIFLDLSLSNFSVFTTLTCHYKKKKSDGLTTNLHHFTKLENFIKNIVRRVGLYLLFNRNVLLYVCNNKGSYCSFCCYVVNSV